MRYDLFYKYVDSNTAWGSFQVGMQGSRTCRPSGMRLTPSWLCLITADAAFRKGHPSGFLTGLAVGVPPSLYQKGRVTPARRTRLSEAKTRTPTCITTLPGHCASLAASRPWCPLCHVFSCLWLKTVLLAVTWATSGASLRVPGSPPCVQGVHVLLNLGLFPSC